MPSRKRFPRLLQNQIDEIRAGRTSSLDLSSHRVGTRFTKVPEQIRAGRPEFASRVYPVVMKDAAIFDPISRIQYIKYWEDQRKALEDAMRQVGQENLQGIREELDLYEKIRNTIAGIMNVLADMNTLTPETHKDTDFDQLYTQLSTALS